MVFNQLGLFTLLGVRRSRGRGGDLYNQGVTALGQEKYDDAAAAFDKIITGYPLSPNIDDVHIRAGFAYLHAGKYAEAVDRLSKEAAANGKPEFRGTALYFTALAQFSKGQKTQTASDYATASTTLTTLINLIGSAPTPDNKGYLEQAIYYRALAYFLKPDYAAAEKDLQQLIQQFPASLSRPDYFLRLGTLYAVEANAAVTDKQPPAAIDAIAEKALAAFDNVSRDPNALVQANDANMSKAEILFLVAQLNATSPDGYQKALDAFRLIKRKDDMIPLQQKRLDDLRKQAQTDAIAHATTGVNALGSDSSLLISREQGRLEELKNGPDPILQALIRMAECYIMIVNPDGTHDSNEARTILHRVAAHAKLTADQQKEVDFQTLYSYVLGGQIDAANKALDDYLAKHTGDPQADTLSYQIAAELMKRKDYDGALAQAIRSLKDFPNGKVAANALALQAEALNKLGRTKEADALVDKFLSANPTSPVANQMFLTKAQGEGARAEYDKALADYGKVKDNTSASPELRAAADAGYIQTLNSMKQYDKLIAEAKTFATQYGTSKALPTVLLFEGLALDAKHDPTAVPALQDLARKFPKDEAAPFALFYVVNSYQRANNVPLMIQAAADFRKAFPDSYALLAQTADAVSAVLLKQKKFEDAIALYQPLTQATDPAVAAAARTKIGSVWIAAAKALGYYQSMPLPTRAEAEKRLAAGEQMYVDTLANSADQLDAVGDAFDGLYAAAKLRRSWGLLKDADLEGYLTKTCASLTSPEMQARLEMAKAGLVFLAKDGAKQYPEAWARYKKVVEANPSLHLTRQETDQYGELALAAKEYAMAMKVYNDLLANAASNDNIAPADANYGIGATYLAQGDVAKAKDYFMKMQTALWHPHIADAKYGIALGLEAGQGPDLDQALQIYAGLMQNPSAGVQLQAKAMVGYGRILEKTGHCIVPLATGPNEFGIHYYQQPDLLFGPATPESSAEGLYQAGQALDKAGHKADARKSYDKLISTYGTTATDWVDKAKAAEATLGQ